MNDQDMTTASYEAQTYPRLNLKDFTLDENNLERDCPLDNGRHQKLPEYDLGTLDSLPLEILQEAISYLDFDTLAALRRVNARAMEVVESVPAYRATLQLCPNIVRGLYSIHYGAYVSLNTLWSTLGRARCEDCGDFGGYIYLLTCRRVCFLCFRTACRFYPLQIAEASKQYGIKKDSLCDIPTMRSVPGVYTGAEKARRIPMVLLDRDMVRQRAIDLHGSEDRMLDFLKQKSTSLEAQYQDRCRAREAGQTDKRLRKPTPAQPTNGRPGDPRRYMAIVQAPYINHQTCKVDFGRFCSACARSYADHEWRRRYVSQSFAEHLHQSGQVIDGSHQLRSRNSSTST